MERSFYKDFSPQTKKDWVNKIKSDLKGKSIDDLNKKISEDWGLSPFHTKDDVRETTTSLSKYYSSCLIAQSFKTDDQNIAEVLNEAKKHGLQVPIFKQVSSPEKLFSRLDAVDWSKFVPVFELSQSAGMSLFKNALAKDQEFYIQTTKPEVDMETDINSKAKIYSYELEAVPGEQMPGELAGWLFSVVQLLDNCEEEEAASLLHRCWIKVNQSNIYYLELARLRAIRILWANLLDNYNIDQQISLPILAKVGPGVDQEDPYRNMIAFTSAGLYAMIGGADILDIDTVGQREGKPAESSQRRLSRNIQHIAKMESFIDEIEDPAAGSYAFENISMQLAQKAWDLFLQKAGSQQS